MLTIPVVGPGAASLYLAAQLGTRISVLTPTGRGYGRVAARLRSLALGELLASVRGSGLSVMDLAQQKPGALDKAADAARVAVEQDGADVLVLGCMSMAFLPGICEALGERVGVPVVNPVVAALKTAEAMTSMRLSHSKAAWPAPKPQEIV
jgi:allantoin racemase